jgi:hypothetical protein
MHDRDLSGFTLDELSWHEDALGRLDRGDSPLPVLTVKEVGAEAAFPGKANLNPDQAEPWTRLSIGVDGHVRDSLPLGGM